MGNEVVESGGARALAERESPTAFNLTPRNLQEALQLAEVLSQSEYVPKDYRGKPGNILVAVQWGHEIGLKPLQAMQNLAVINGRPTLWGDALVALVRNSPLCEYIIETTDAAGTAFCQVKRRGEPEQVRSFSDADAKTAGLLGKDGPWKSNPKRMKQMRARAFALRDVFADVLKGMQMAEEIMDLPPSEATPTPADQLAGAAPAVPPELLEAAQKAAAGGQDVFRAWFKDKSNGGQTTREQRDVLKHHLADFHATALAADEKAAADKAAAGKPAATEVVDAGATTTPGPTFGDDSSAAVAS